MTMYRDSDLPEQTPIGMFEFLTDNSDGQALSFNRAIETVSIAFDMDTEQTEAFRSIACEF